MVSIADNDQEKLTRRRPGADPLAPLCTANPERGSGVGSWFCGGCSCPLVEVSLRERQR